MSQKMNLFLKAIANPTSSLDDSHFTQDDIVQLCKSALFVLGQKDQFYEELSLNFAKFIYHTLGKKWTDTEPIHIRTL